VDGLLLSIFARGRFGEVQRCREWSTGREFAAKFIATSEPKDRQEAVNEVDIMLKLRHCRRLVQLYDVFETKKNMCLVLEVYVFSANRYLWIASLWPLTHCDNK